MGKFCTEIHSILRAVYPRIYKIELNLFYIKRPEPVDLQWCFKMIGEDINNIIVPFAFAMYTKDKSLLFYLISCFFILYNVMDLVLFMYNFNSNPIVYWVLIFISFLAVILLIFIKPKLKAI